MRERFATHASYRSLAKGSGRQIIHDALLKYGPANFAYLCFILSSGLSTDFSSIASLAQEQFLLHHLVNTAYNVNKFANRPQIRLGSDHQIYNTGFPSSSLNDDYGR